MTDSAPDILRDVLGSDVHNEEWLSNATDQELLGARMDLAKSLPRRTPQERVDVWKACDIADDEMKRRYPPASRD